MTLRVKHLVPAFLLYFECWLHTCRLRTTSSWSIQVRARTHTHTQYAGRLGSHTWSAFATHRRIRPAHFLPLPPLSNAVAQHSGLLENIALWRPFHVESQCGGISNYHQVISFPENRTMQIWKCSESSGISPELYFFCLPSRCAMNRSSKPVFDSHEHKGVSDFRKVMSCRHCILCKCPSSCQGSFRWNMLYVL